jgi:hypothetical protein
VLLVNFIRRAQALVSAAGNRPAAAGSLAKPASGKQNARNLQQKLSEIDVRILQLAELKQQLSAQLMQECPLRNC